MGLVHVDDMGTILAIQLMVYVIQAHSSLCGTPVVGLFRGQM